MEPAHAPGTSNIADFMERLIAGLLGLGWSDSALLTGIYRRLRLRNARGRRDQVAILLGKPWRAVRRCRQFVRVHGAAVESAFGVGRARQFGMLLLADCRHSLNPGRFMMCWALGSGARRKWRGYFTPWHSHVLLGDLADRCDAPLRRTLRDKRSFAAWAGARELRTVPVLAEFAGGRQSTALEAGDLPPVDLFAKPADLFCGEGTIRWRSTDGEWVDQAGVRMGAEGVLACLAERSHAHPYVLQPCLAPHPSFARFGFSAVPTLRAVTCMDRDGHPRLLRASVRLPGPGMIVDNVTAGGMVAAVDLGTGQLGDGVCWRPDLLADYCTRHPGSGVTVPGFAVPDWPAARDLALAAQREAATLPFVGWDVALTAEGPILLEANIRWAGDIVTVPQREALGDAGFCGLFVRAWFDGVAGTTVPASAG